MRYLTLILLMVIPAISHAQKIKGAVMDESGLPVNGATVSLINLKDSSAVKLAVTKNGQFEIAGMKEGEYRLLLTSIGFNPAYSEKINYQSTDLYVPTMLLKHASTSLSNVNVAARKPIVEVKADRTVLNVEGTINATGSNALELLRKSPGILLDKDDNISLMGKNGVQVYIDNKPTPLSGQDLAHYLKSLQSAQIEAIELITNPSAKYDAAGNAGIINIKLIKNKSLGANGSVNAGLNIAKSTRYNAGFSYNYRNKSINIFSTYNYNYAPNKQFITLYRTVLDSAFDQVNNIDDLRRSHNIKVGMDYFLNKKSTIGIMMNGIFSDPENESHGKTIISNTGSGDVARLLVSDNDNFMKRHNANFNLNYNYADPKGKSLSINVDRGSYNFNSDQVQRNYYFDETGQVSLGNVIYRMTAPAIIKIHSIKGDYEQNLLKGKLAVGIKNAWVSTDNDFKRYNIYGLTEDPDEERSNHFLYKENINAAYFNYSRQGKKISYQLGLRAENTVSEGQSTGLKWDGNNYIPDKNSFKRVYTDLFPSVGISFVKNPKKTWSISYSRRIDRPAYQDLNPFEFKLDEYTYMKGNVNLRPQYTNSFAISHVRNMKLNLSLNYSHVRDMFTQVFDTIDKSRAFVSKRNLATQDIVSFNASYPFQYKYYSLFANVSTNYSVFKADFGTGRKVDLAAFGLTVFTQHSVKFKKTWTAELSGFFNAPTIYQGSLKGKLMFGIDAGLSKQLFKGKATVKVAVSDIFYSQQFRASTNFAGQQMRFTYRQESRQLKLSFNYRFGNAGVKAARNRSTGAEEETKRVQPVGGMIGN